MENNKLKVTIGGNVYTIISEKSKLEIERIASFVDEEINKILKNNYRLNPIMASTLVALNISEKYFDLQEEVEKIANDKNYPLKKYDEMSVINNNLQIENDSLKKENDELKSQIENLIESIKTQNKKYEDMENKVKQNYRKLNFHNNEILNIKNDLSKLKEEYIKIKKDITNTNE